MIRHLLEYDLSLTQLGFGVITACVLVVGILINVAEKHLPVQLVSTYKYGKLIDRNAKEILKTVPKSWFSHFYVVGAIWSIVIMGIFYTVYVIGEKPPAWFISFLNTVASRRRNSSGTAAAALLGIFLLFIHCCLRLLEVCFISVYSPSRINIAHYGCGILHYIGATIAIAAESPGFSNIGEESSFSWSQLTCVELTGVLIFCVASYQQLNSSVTLANLRKNKKGIIFTYRHSVPRGGLFEFISSPHIVAEILIYMALTVILRNNKTWWLVFIWVLVNQSESALMNHWWYKENFPNYPRVRKALIPFLL